MSLEPIINKIRHNKASGEANFFAWLKKKTRKKRDIEKEQEHLTPDFRVPRFPGLKAIHNFIFDMLTQSIFRTVLFETTVGFYFWNWVNRITLLGMITCTVNSL